MRYVLVLIAGLILLGCRGGFHLDVEAMRTYTKSHTVDSAAHWIDHNIVLLPDHDAASHIRLISFPDGLKGDTKPSAFQLSQRSFPEQLKTKFPDLAHLNAYEIKAKDSRLKPLLRGEIIIGSWNGKTLSDMHYVQTAGAIDAIYTSGNNDADEVPDYGAVLSQDAAQFKLWAPSAKSVILKTYNEAFVVLDEFPMQRSEASGVWHTNIPRAAGPLSEPLYYRYNLEVFHPASRKVEIYEVTDPYALGLSANGEFSRITDLDNPALKPDGWDASMPPALSAPQEQIIYKLHIGDFSGTDKSTPTDARGRYAAFNYPDSAPMQHLAVLIAAGVNTVHLMPVFDFGAVNEIAFERLSLDSTIADACALTSRQAIFCKTSDFDHDMTLSALLQSYDSLTMDAQNTVAAIADMDDYNHGYNPVHYSAPEGSYASDPDNGARILELRQMVKTLHDMGLTVTMDVSQALAYQSGLNRHSVLDKVVPGYYLSRDVISGQYQPAGDAVRTAPSRAMMAKLMTDSLAVWKRAYKIDGFHFDKSDSSKPELALWDQLQYDVPADMPLETRARRQAQSLSLDLFAQGPATLQMGNEILRSKSFQKGSSNAGHFFNAVDYTYAGNNYNVGLPRAGDNPGDIIAAHQGRDTPTPDLIQKTFDMTQDFIAIRRASPLFTLPSDEAVEARVNWLSETKSVPEGVTVLSLDDGHIDPALESLDPGVSQIIILFNQSAERQTIAVKNAARLRLHPVQISGTDLRVKQSQILLDSVSVPAFTTAVFVRPE